MKVSVIHGATARQRDTLVQPLAHRRFSLGLRAAGLDRRLVVGHLAKQQVRLSLGERAAACLGFGAADADGLDVRLFNANLGQQGLGTALIHVPAALHRFIVLLFLYVSKGLAFPRQVV